MKFESLPVHKSLQSVRSNKNKEIWIFGYFVQTDKGNIQTRKLRSFYIVTEDWMLFVLFYGFQTVIFSVDESEISIGMAFGANVKSKTKNIETFCPLCLCRFSSSSSSFPKSDKDGAIKTLIRTYLAFGGMHTRRMQRQKHLINLNFFICCFYVFFLRRFGSFDIIKQNPKSYAFEYAFLLKWLCQHIIKQQHTKWRSEMRERGGGDGKIEIPHEIRLLINN